MNSTKMIEAVVHGKDAVEIINNHLAAKPKSVKHFKAVKEGLDNIMGVDDFVNAYKDCALWSSNDESDESGGEPLDSNYSRADISNEASIKMQNDCEKFKTENEADIGDNEEQAGHDFWLTRNCHGAGFWDRPEVYGEEQAKRLTDAAHKFGECNLYVTDDGEIDIM